MKHTAKQRIASMYKISGKSIPIILIHESSDTDIAKSKQTIPKKREIRTIPQAVQKAIVPNLFVSMYLWYIFWSEDEIVFDKGN